ncbi:MAG: cobaltochelatase subunit CobS, partial [Novosphingobium sp.]
MTDIPNIQLDTSGNTILSAPDLELDVREVFGIDIDMKVPAFSVADERVPDVDPTYVFD